MGTDIHAAIEYRMAKTTKTTDPGRWTAVTHPNRYFGKYDDEPQFSASLDIGRDYKLFAILGGVHNGVGFAGVDMGDQVTPMSDCRGVPEDSAPETLAVLSNEHSATWVTLAEILAYDWTRTVNHRGVVNMVQFEEWDRMREWQKEPQSYCGDTSGPGIVYISEAEMKQKVDELRAHAQKISGDRYGSAYHETLGKLIDAQPSRFHARVQWEKTYAEDATALWTKVLPQMLKLADQPGVGAENVRLVMGFR